LFDSPQARYSFVTARPFLTFRSFGSRCKITPRISRLMFNSANRKRHRKSREVFDKTRQGQRLLAGLIIRIGYYQIALTPLKPLVLGEYFEAEAGENETGGVASLKLGGSYGRKANGTSVAKTSPIRHEGAGLPPPCKPIP
jgi:hypothetical protein